MEENQRTPKMNKLEKGLFALGTLGGLGGLGTFLLTDIGSEISAYASDVSAAGLFMVGLGTVLYATRNRNALTPPEYRKYLKK